MALQASAAAAARVENVANVENMQLGLYDGAEPARNTTLPSHAVPASMGAASARPAAARPAMKRPEMKRPEVKRPDVKLCAGCRAKEARYGFRDDEREERPRTLCFQCFRMEIDWRQRVAAQLARGWNAQQEELPLAATLKALRARRRRAQIAARHALGA